MLLKCSPPLTHLFNFEKDRCKFAFNNKYFKRSYTVGPSNAPFTFQTNCKVAPAVEFIFTYSAGRNLIDLLETTSSHLGNNTAQGVKISIEYFFNKCDQIHSFQRIWSHLLKKTLMENFIFFLCSATIFQENSWWLVEFEYFFFFLDLCPTSKS